MSNRDKLIIKAKAAIIADKGVVYEPSQDEINAWVFEHTFKARKLLESAGFFTANLWHTDDVRSTFNCTEQEAQKVLYDVFLSSRICDEIFQEIERVAEIHGLAKGVER